MWMRTRKLLGATLVTMIAFGSIVIPGIAAASPRVDAVVAPMAYTERVIDKVYKTTYYETGQVVNSTVYKTLTFPTSYELTGISGPTYQYGLTYERVIYTYNYRIW